jgi:hypothetical protein
MLKKIIGFIGNLLLAFAIGVTTFVFGGMFSTSLHVTCELQSDTTYTCQARDTLLEWTVAKKQAEHVIGMEQHLKCSGSGSKRGCSYLSDFVTTTGEKIQLSHLFTSSKSEVTEAVGTIDGLMRAKSTPIEYTSKFSPWLAFNICLSSFMLVMFVLRAFLSLSDKRVSGIRQTPAVEKPA